MPSNWVGLLVVVFKLGLYRALCGRGTEILGYLEGVLPAPCLGDYHK